VCELSCSNIEFLVLALELTLPIKSNAVGRELHTVRRVIILVIGIFVGIILIDTTG
jgi:hypothetical protein